MGILQARILEWVAMPSSRGSSQPRDQTQVSGIVGEDGREGSKGPREPKTSETEKRISAVAFCSGGAYQGDPLSTRRTPSGLGVRPHLCLTGLSSAIACCSELGPRPTWSAGTSVFLSSETGVSGNIWCRIKGAKYRFALQDGTWDFS